MIYYIYILYNLFLLSKLSYLHSARPGQRRQQARDQGYPRLHHHHQALLPQLHGDVVPAQTVAEETNQAGVPQVAQQEDLPHQQVVSHGFAEVGVVHLLHAGDLGLDVVGLALDGHQGASPLLPLPAVEAVQVAVGLLQLLHVLPVGRAQAPQNLVVADLAAGHGAVEVQSQHPVLQDDGHLVRLLGRLPAGWVQDGQHFPHLLHLPTGVELLIQISPRVPVVKQPVLRVGGLVSGLSLFHGGQGAAEWGADILAVQSSVGEEDADEQHRDHHHGQHVACPQAVQPASANHGIGNAVH